MMAVCDFCWRHCSIPEGARGACNVRENREGTIRTLGYGRIVAAGIDPIEKKPLYHFLPFSRTVSFALFGCNFSCLFCQNCTISQKVYFPGQGRSVQPKELVALAVRERIPSISYTYSEPLVWQDYLLQVARLAHREGRYNIMVTNGSFSREALDRLLPVVDAYNIDVKGDEAFYRSVCNGSLKPVLSSIARIVASGRHLEVTTMVIASLHTPAMIADLGRKLCDLGVRVWHLSRFFPMYRMQDHPATSEAFLSEAIDVARSSGIPYVYAGNSIGELATYCPDCHALLIPDRMAPGSEGSRLEDGCCPSCGHRVYGVFS